jgi:hypothetical protein
MIRCLLMIFATIIAGTAQDSDVLLVALDGGIGAGVPEAVERFQSSEVEIPAIFLRSTLQQDPPVADVFLDGDALGVPLSASLPFQTSASAHPWLIEGKFRLALPENAKPYRLRVRFREARLPGRVIGWVTVRVFPPEDLKDVLSRWLRQEGNEEVALFGESKGLRELFSGWGIPYTDFGPEFPSASNHRLMIGSTASLEKLPSQGRNPLFLLSTDPEPEGARWVQTLNHPNRLLVRIPGNPDWRSSPLLHRLLCSELALITQRHD